MIFKNIIFKNQREIMFAISLKTSQFRIATARVTTSFEKSRFLKNAPFDFLKNLGTYPVFNALSDEHIEKCST